MASNQRIKADQLTDVVSGILAEYEEDVIAALKAETARAARQMKSSTVAKASGYGWQNYPGSIAIRRHADTMTGSVFVWYVKAPHYRLSHLLEFGHVTRNGGFSKAFGFIEASLNEVERDFDRNVRRAIVAIR